MIGEFISGLNEFLSTNFLGNTVEQYLNALIVFIAIFIGIKVFKTIIVSRLKKLAKKTETELDDLIVALISELSWTLYLLLPAYLALSMLVVPPIVLNVFYFAIFIVIVFYVIRGLMHVIDYAKKLLIKQRLAEEKEADTTAIDLLGKFAKGLVWLFAVFFILSNLGYDITALIAGLGIGGIAIAFALQNVLSDIFASFSIYFDRPFKKGDFVVIGEDSGTVKKIGIKSTRIKTLQGDELVVSNRELTGARVHNYKRMKKRRVAFSFGLTYDTPVKKLRKIPSLVEGILKKIDKVKLDRVHFKEFGDFSLNYEVVYLIDSSDYLLYRNIQQEINLALKEKLEKEKIEMAFPTQTIYLHKG